MTTISRPNGGILLFAPFSASVENPITGTLKENDQAAVNFVITGTFFLAASATVNGVHYRNFLSAASAKFGGISPGGRAYVVSTVYVPRQNELRIAADTPNLVLTLSVPSTSLLTQRVLGLAGSTISSNITSSAGCHYAWLSSFPERTKWTRPYEPQAFFIDHEAEDGTAYPVGRTASPIYSDWAFEFEPASKMWTRFAPTSEPYTLQDFVETVRADKPFLLFTSSLNSTYTDLTSYQEAAYQLRAEGSFWKVRFKDVNWHTRLHFDFKTRVISSSYGNGGY